MPPAAAPGFAPVTPAPPATGYGVPGGTVPPGGNPWAAPGHGVGPGHPWGPPPPATNGLAVAALIVGIFGLLFGPMPFLFWAGTLLGVTALGLGIGALARASRGAGRKPMAITGTILGVLAMGASVGGFFLTDAIVDKTRDRIDRQVDHDWPEPEPEDDFGADGPAPWPSKRAPAPSPKPPKGPGMTTPLPFGETYTYPNGIKVSLSAPKKYVTKSKYSKVGNAVEMTLTITNNSTQPHNVIYAMPNVRDDKGMTAKLVFDGDVPKMISGDILPGESASGVVAFEVPEGTTRISADISPGTLMPGTKFSGPVVD